LQPFAQDNVLYQQMLGESLLSIGLAQTLLYTAISETDDLRELKDAYSKAQDTFQRAHNHFVDMQQRGVLSPQGLSHLDNAAEMRSYLSEMHQKLRATYGDIH
jgi:RES domain-containing protein